MNDKITLTPGKLYQLKNNDYCFGLYQYSNDKSKPISVLKSIRITTDIIVMFLSIEENFENVPGVIRTKWLYENMEFESSLWSDLFLNTLQHFLKEMGHEQ